MRTNPAFAGTYDFSDTATFAATFPRFLDRLPDGSVVMCHPGFVDAELQRLDPLTTLREREYAFFAGDDFPALLGTARRVFVLNCRALAGLQARHGAQLCREIFAVPVIPPSPRVPT